MGEGCPVTIATHLQASQGTSKTFSASKQAET